MKKYSPIVTAWTKEIGSLYASSWETAWKALHDEESICEVPGIESACSLKSNQDSIELLRRNAIAKQLLAIKVVRTIRMLGAPRAVVTRLKKEGERLAHEVEVAISALPSELKNCIAVPQESPSCQQNP